MNQFVRSLMLLVGLLIAACGAPPISPDTPPEIVYGEDVCDHCGMIINEERFAAGAVMETSDGKYEHLAFDDIGDMFAYAEELKAAGEMPRIDTYFVHDYRSLEWLDAQAAHFVVTKALLTPMGSGLVAFASLEDAEAQAATWQATVLDFAAAQQHYLEMNHGHAHH